MRTAAQIETVKDKNMLCYVMLCYGMLCYVRSCYVMLCCVKECATIDVMPCHIMLQYTMKIIIIHNNI